MFGMVDIVLEDLSRVRLFAVSIKRHLIHLEDLVRGDLLGLFSWPKTR
jgi:hypothetical protein